MTNLDDVVTSLREAVLLQEEVVNRENAKLASMRQALQQLTNPNTVIVTDVKRRDYEHMGPTEAAEQWLREVGGSQHTEDIAKALLERGIKTKSERYTPNVYASLNNSEKFIREGEGRDGTWRLRSAEDPRPRKSWSKKKRGN